MDKQRRHSKVNFYDQVRQLLAISQHIVHHLSHRVLRREFQCHRLCRQVDDIRQLKTMTMNGTKLNRLGAKETRQEVTVLEEQRQEGEFEIFQFFFPIK
jgi:hypothetical protein